MRTKSIFCRPTVHTSTCASDTERHTQCITAKESAVLLVLNLHTADCTAYLCTADQLNPRCISKRTVLQKTRAQLQPRCAVPGVSNACLSSAVRQHHHIADLHATMIRYSAAVENSSEVPRPTHLHMRTHQFQRRSWSSSVCSCAHAQKTPTFRLQNAAHIQP